MAVRLVVLRWHCEQHRPREVSGSLKVMELSKRYRWELKPASVSLEPKRYLRERMDGRSSTNILLPEAWYKELYGLDPRNLSWSTGQLSEVEEHV